MQSWLEGIICVGKVTQATGMTASLRILLRKAVSNTWKSFTRSELKLECIKSHHTQTSSGKSLPSHFWNINIRSILPGLRRKGTGLLLSGPKSSFQMKVNFAFHLEIKVPESGGRVERHIFHVAWSPVWSFHSQWWFGVPCHLLMLVLCVFWSPVNAAIYQEILEHFMLPSADKLYGDADFIFQQDLAPAHTAKGTKSWFNDHGVTVLDWPANLPDINSIENLWRWETPDPTMQMDLKDAIKATWASIPPQQCHRLIVSRPRRIDAVIHAKVGPTKCWVHRNEHTFQKPGISV